MGGNRRTDDAKGSFSQSGGEGGGNRLPERRCKIAAGGGIGFGKEYPERLAIYAFTMKGAELGISLALRIGGDVYLPSRLAERFPNIRNINYFDALSEIFQGLFGLYRAHVFIGAAGIAVRTIAPYLRGKSVDPAVAVVDQSGKYVISLLSGHEGGGNALTAEIAGIIGGEAVITTATDVQGLPSFDVLAAQRGLSIGNREILKRIAAYLLDGVRIQVYDPEGWLGSEIGAYAAGHLEAVPSPDLWRRGRPGVWVSVMESPYLGETLFLHPRILVVGVGCRRGLKGEAIAGFIGNELRNRGLAAGSIRTLASVELKRDDTGLARAAEILGAGLIFVSAGELDSVDVPNPSEKVFARVGTKSVCEAAALHVSGAETLLVEKITGDNMTMAVAVDIKKVGKI